MKRNPIAAALLAPALAIVAPAQAETVQDDIRCVLLSGIFIKSAKDEKGKQIAQLTGAFYLGRLDGRAAPAALTAALRAESKALDGKIAGPLMDACAKKMAAAQKAVNDAGRAAAPAQPAK